MDVITDEFRVLKEDMLKAKITCGDIRINDNIVPTDYVFKDLDRLSSRVHRHELPVLATDIKIIRNDDKFLVVDKPPSLPVHPCGRYRFNTVLALLYKEYGFGRDQLFICHRLDRLTSGVLIFAKNSEVSNQFMKELCERKVQKEYLCRVEGDFPDGEVTVDQPLEQINHKLGLSIVSKSPAAKESKTVFKKLSFNGKSSLVHCIPKTGRTHQIRVHLQYLGYPIINDNLYNSYAFGPNKGKGADYAGKSNQELYEALRKEHNVEDWTISAEELVKMEHPENEDAETFDSTKAYIGSDFKTKEPGLDISKVHYDPGCEECTVKYRSPKARSLMIFLHALKYSVLGETFETERPFWARDDYDAM